MFWRVAGFTQPSPIETILDKENFTLEELLDEDDLIQECKALNGRLINFLRERSTVEKLLRYLVQNPEQPGTAAPTSDADSKQQFKYPYAACEVFCCEVDGIFSTLLTDDELLAQLFGLLDHEGSLNCVTAGYFARVVGTLLFRRTADIMRYLESHQAVLHRLIAHLDTTSIAEIVVRLVGAEEQTGMYLAPTQVSWLTETDLMALLLERLGPGFPPDAQKHAAEILAAVARSQLSPLVRVMSAPECLQVLFERAFTSEGASSVQALDVCIALLEPRPGPVDGYGNSPTGGARGSPSQEARQALQAEAVAGMSPYCSRLVGMLDDSHAPQPQETPFGVLSPPLGSARLKAVETVAALVRVSDDTAERTLMGAGLIPRCLELFLRFPFNNLLHHQVTAMLMGALESGSDALIQYVFETAHVLSWLVDAPTEVSPPLRDGGNSVVANGMSRQPLRAGYMGHVTYIANKLLEAGMQSEQMRRYLDAHTPWQEYVDEILKPRNGVENVMKWACGRPLASDLTAIGSEGEEAEQMMDLEPLPPLTAAKPAVGAAPASQPRYVTGGAGDEAIEVDGSGQALTDAGLAFEALHLAPRLTVTAGGGGDSDSTDSSSSTSSSSGGDSSDSSDEDGAGGLDLLGPPVEVTGRPGFPPARARSLDDDDVVLVAPFDEELDDAEEEEEHPGSAPDTAEQPPTAEANHVSGHQAAPAAQHHSRQAEAALPNDFGDRLTLGTGGHAEGHTNKAMQDDFPADHYRAATAAPAAGSWGEVPLHGGLDMGISGGSLPVANGPDAEEQRQRPGQTNSHAVHGGTAAVASMQAAAEASEHGSRGGSSSNGANLAELSPTPSSQSPIAEAAEADSATANGGGVSDLHEVGSTRRSVTEQSALGDEVWEPSWPTVDVAPAHDAGAPRDEQPAQDPAREDPESAPLVVSLAEPAADASGSSPTRSRSKGGIASGFAAQHAAQSAAGAASPSHELDDARGPHNSKSEAGHANPLHDSAVAAASSGFESGLAASGGASVVNATSRQQVDSSDVVQRQPVHPVDAATLHTADKGEL